MEWAIDRALHRQGMFYPISIEGLVDSLSPADSPWQTFQEVYKLFFARPAKLTIAQLDFRALLGGQIGQRPLTANSGFVYDWNHITRIWLLPNPKTGD